MPNKNPYLTELKRYLAEVSIERQRFSMGGLSDRVAEAQANGVPSLDIVDSITGYAKSSAKCMSEPPRVNCGEADDPNGWL